MPIVTQITNSISGSISSGGVEIVVRTWQKAFKKLGYESYVFAMYDKNDKPNETINPNFRLISCRVNPKKSWRKINFRGILEIYRAVSTTDYLFIHFCKDLFTNIATLIAIIKRRNFVFQTHGMIRLESENRFTQYYLKFVLRKAKIIFTLTNNESNNFKRMGILNICEINNPLDINGLPEANRKKNLLYIGRFHERKRPEIAIEAMSEVIKSRPDFLLQMYGPESSYKETMKILVKDRELQDYVHINKAVSNFEAKKLLSESSIFLLPSYSEIFPIAMIEAMLYRCPVICGPDNGLLKKFQNQNLVLEANSAKDFSQQILEIVNSDELRTTLSENSYNWVTKHCDSIELAKMIVHNLCIE